MEPDWLRYSSAGIVLLKKEMDHWLTVYQNQNQSYVLWITQNVYPIYKQNKHNLKIFKIDSICETV